MIVRIDVVPIVLEMRRVIVAEVIGGYHGQAQLGRWWLPSGVLAAGEQPGEKAVQVIRDQLGLELEGAVVVGTRAEKVAGADHLALVFAGAISGGEPAPRNPVTGYSARAIPDLPDQVGFHHREIVEVLVARYERLRA